MQHRKAFTAKEVIIVIAIFSVAICVFLTAVWSNRRPGSNRYSTRSIRGIHTGMVLYAQGNNGYYPGIMADGQTIAPAVGLTTQGRIQILINQNYITRQYAISYFETQTGTTSFAMLKIDIDHESQTIAKSIRNSQWKDTSNAQSIVISDRAVPMGGSYANIKSIQTNPWWGKSDWQGSVAWNDNHASFETTHNLTTKYGEAVNTSDNLFATSSDPNNGDDAFMVFHGTDGL